MIPDIGTSFTTSDNRSYRIEAWLKAVPLKFQPVDDEIYINEILEGLFLESHPNWNYEYELVHCTREEATHVSGRGVCGATVSLSDKTVKFSHVYLWDAEHVEESRQRALRMIPFYNQFRGRIIEGEYHE